MSHNFRNQRSLLQRMKTGQSGRRPPAAQIPSPWSSIIPRPSNSINNPQVDRIRTITVDGLPKEIRFYDQVAIVFMDFDKPREIGFSAGQRLIIIDNQPPLALQFNDDYRAITIGGETARIRFGFPSRELYIDEHWYEIRFGGPPITIPLRQRMHTIQVESPPPRVNIGPLRRDLVVGKISMTVDGFTIVSLFLDARAQCFRLGHCEHTLQFADQLATVLLDGEPTRFEYGGRPKSVTLGGKIHFLEFGSLPQGIVAGKVKIRDMIYVNMQKPVEEELPMTTCRSSADASAQLDKLVATLRQQLIRHVLIELQFGANTRMGKQAEEESPMTTMESTPTMPNFLAATAMGINIDEIFQKFVSSGIVADKMTAVVPAASERSSPDASAPPKKLDATPAHKLIRHVLVEKQFANIPQDVAAGKVNIPAEEVPPMTNTASTPTLPNLMVAADQDNIKVGDIFQKLVLSGIVADKMTAVAPDASGRSSPDASAQPNKLVAAPSQNLFQNVLSINKNIITRRTKVAMSLYSGLQCSNCGIRFTTKESIKYPRHLDWHFPQNRLKRELSLRAHSRAWYRGLDDWLHPDETEEHEASALKQPGLPVPSSVVSGPEDVNRTCVMCMEPFEQLYNDDLEEWHLCSAMRVDEKIYHRSCYSGPTVDSKI